MYFYHLYLAIIKIAKSANQLIKRIHIGEVYDTNFTIHLNYTQICSTVISKIWLKLRQNVPCLTPWTEQMTKPSDKTTNAWDWITLRKQTVSDSHVSKPLNWEWPTQSHILSPMPQATFLTSTKPTNKKPSQKKKALPSSPSCLNVSLPSSTPCQHPIVCKLVVILSSVLSVPCEKSVRWETHSLAHSSQWFRYSAVWSSSYVVRQRGHCSSAAPCGAVLLIVLFELVSGGLFLSGSAVSVCRWGTFFRPMWSRREDGASWTLWMMKKQCVLLIWIIKSHAGWAALKTNGNLKW